MVNLPFTREQRNADKLSLNQTHVVVGPAGSGKTSLACSRLRHLLDAQNRKPSCLVVPNPGARERILRDFPEADLKPHVKTASEFVEALAQEDGFSLSFDPKPIGLHEIPDNVATGLAFWASLRDHKRFWHVILDDAHWASESILRLVQATGEHVTVFADETESAQEILLRVTGLQRVSSSLKDRTRPDTLTKSGKTAVAISFLKPEAGRAQLARALSLQDPDHSLIVFVNSHEAREECIKALKRDQLLVDGSKVRVDLYPWSPGQEADVVAFVAEQGVPLAEVRRWLSSCRSKARRHYILALHKSHILDLEESGALEGFEIQETGASKAPRDPEPDGPNQLPLPPL